jgi:hypothetical protein
MIPYNINKSRRRLLQTSLTSPLLWPLLASAQDPVTLLREGGLVLAMRHALAPGTFDPPEFKLGDCSTQRNLSEEGRAQARRIGAWFGQHKLRPSRVRSSPWCRCVDTATLAFGSAEPWAALGSPRGATEGTNAVHLQALRQALVAASAQRGRFEVWVTHMFVLADLTQQNTASGEALLLRAGKNAADGVQVLGRLALN